MTAYHRSALEITIEDLRDNPVHILFDRWQKLIDIQDELIGFLKEYESNIRTQEIAVNSVKTANAGFSIAGTVLLFTPLAPLGLGLMAFGGVSAIATSAGDSIANKVKGGWIGYKLAEEQAAAADLQAI